MESKLSQIAFNLNGGKSATLSDYDDKVIMLVNVASQCGLTPQYEGLERIYEKYQEKGFLIIGFPANEFAAQEPGSNSEIQEFCKLNYGVKFPIAEKIIVKGDSMHPLYQILTEEKPIAAKNTDSALEGKLNEHGLLSGKAGDIMWNFEKFLIGKDGNIIERFAPDVPPEDPMIVKAIEAALNK